MPLQLGSVPLQLGSVPLQLGSVPLQLGSVPLPFASSALCPGLVINRASGSYSTPSAPAPTLGIEPVCPSARPRVVLAPARQRDCECSLLSRWRHLRRTSGNPRLQHPLSGQVSAPAVAAARNHTAATRSLHPPPTRRRWLAVSLFLFLFFWCSFTWGSGEALISTICGLPSHFDTNSNRNRNPLSLCRPSRT